MQTTRTLDLLAELAPALIVHRTIFNGPNGTLSPLQDPGRPIGSRDSEVEYFAHR